MPLTIHLCYEDVLSSAICEHQFDCGVIDGSVLTAVGELLLFGVILQVPSIINSAKDGKHIRLTKGDFTAEVSSEQTISE